jgi:predicted ATPase
MGPGAADIGELLPEVREKLPDLGPPTSLEPDQARFRLFDSIARFIKNMARNQPMMLILDDLHWADRPSLMLLEFLGQELI